MASDTMKGGTRSFVTARPLIAPTASPTSSPTATPARRGAPRTSASAQRTPDKPTTDPTERSMPPVRITRLIPAARMAVNAFCRTTLARLLSVKNASVANARTRHSATNAAKIA